MASPGFGATWNGGGVDDLASNPLNWTGNVLPPYGDTISFDATSTKDCTWDLTETYAALTIGGGFTGAITLNSALTLTYMADLSTPIDLVSSSHPDPNLWYNDGLGDWSISWNKPFPNVLGYYYLLSTSLTDTPTASNGIFLQQEFYTVPAADLQQGQNYFHIVSVNQSSTVSSVDNTLKVQINTFPPTVSSSSHPNQTTWYPNNNAFLTWTNPQADSNFTGYYYIVDASSSTIPTAATGIHLPAGQKQILLILSNGVWVFHLVSIDTQNATTKMAAHYYLHIGTGP